MQRVKKGDEVEVIAGKDRGFRGEVIQVLNRKNRVVVNGINMAKKHQAARQAGGQNIPAQILDFEAPLHMSNVMVVCPSCDKATRIGYRFNDDGHKTRFCKKCDSDMD